MKLLFSIVLQARDFFTSLLKKEVVFIDVREQYEYDSGHIKGIKLIPMGELEKQIPLLDKKLKYITVCGIGVRSLKAAKKMKEAGLNVSSMSGGMTEWTLKGLPVKK